MLRLPFWAFFAQTVRTLFTFALVPLLGVAQLDGQERLILPDDGPHLDVEVEALYSVGALDGEDWEVFSRISAVAFDDEGCLYVLDRGNFRVVKFGPDGEFLLAMGREGGGPGEFASPRAMAVTPEGSVVVYDSRSRGFTLFNPDGTVRETVPLTSGPRARPGSPMVAHPSGGVVSVGTLVARAGERIEFGTSNATRPPLVLHSLEDGSYRSLRPERRPASAQSTPVRRSGAASGPAGMGRSRLRAFDPGLHFGVLPGGAVAVVDSAAYEVKLLDVDGGVQRVLSLSILPRETGPEDREAEINRRLAAARERSSKGSGASVSGGRSGGVVRRSMAGSEQMEERIRSMEFAELIPVVKGLAVDPEGRIWIERHGEPMGEPGPMDLLSPESGHLGSMAPGVLRIPDALGPGGLAAFIELDELDVPRVEVKRILGLPG